MNGTVFAQPAELSTLRSGLRGNTMRRHLLRLHSESSTHKEVKPNPKPPWSTEIICAKTVITEHFCWNSKGAWEVPSAKSLTFKTTRGSWGSVRGTTSIQWCCIMVFLKQSWQRPGEASPPGPMLTLSDLLARKPMSPKTLEYRLKYLLICHFCRFSSNPQSPVTRYLPTICFSNTVSDGIQTREMNPSKSEICK